MGNLLKNNQIRVFNPKKIIKLKLNYKICQIYLKMMRRVTIDSLKYYFFMINPKNILIFHNILFLII